MLKIFRKLICTCMALMMVISLLPVHAEAFGADARVYIISNTLSAHKEANASSKVLGTMSFGESMTMISFSGSWVKIRNSKGQVTLVWQPKVEGAANHYLDCEVYCMAAADIKGVRNLFLQTKVEDEAPPAPKKEEPPSEEQWIRTNDNWI